MRLPFSYIDYIAAPPTERRSMLNSNEYQFEKALREIHDQIRSLKRKVRGTPEWIEERERKREAYMAYLKSRPRREEVEEFALPEGFVLT